MNPLHFYCLHSLSNVAVFFRINIYVYSVQMLHYTNKRENMKIFALH